MGTPLQSLIPDSPNNSYFYKNGFSKLMPRLRLQVHTKLDECRDLWNEFSPDLSLFDSWNFRLAWNEGYETKAYFYTLYETGNPVAMLPVCFNHHGKNRYEWFGTYWMEGSSLFVKDTHYLDLLYAILPVPIHLNGIHKQNWDNLRIAASLKPDDPRNIREIAQYQQMDALLADLDKKHRYSLRADYMSIMELAPRIVHHDSPTEDLLDTMIDMNIAQFADRPDDQSDLIVPERRRTYKNILKNSETYKIKFIEVYIQNHLAAIDMIVTYRDTYYMFKGGLDVQRFPKLNNFMVYYEFEDAIRGEYSVVDSLQIDYGWKHRFFDQVPTYLLEK